MPAPIDATGKTYGRLTVISKAVDRVSASGNKRSMWLCRCECGESCEVGISKLQSGWTKSCGCLQLEIANTPRTHGMRMRGEKTKGYRSWASMRNRCSNPKTKGYHNYGGRGISVCDRWSDFSNFISDMGEPISEDLSIDRINTNGNYEPGNCRWATAYEQANNLRTTRFFSCDGQTLSISQWAEILGTSRDSIKLRLKRGQSFASIHAHFSSKI